jgi:hypothetical protein
MHTTFAERPADGVLFRGTPWTGDERQTLAEARAERDGRDAATRAASPDGMTAMERAIAQIGAAARRGVIETTKRRARAYIRRPVHLNALAWNLSQAEPVEGIQMVRRLAHEDGPTINLGAAMVAFRWARRAEANGRLEELLFGEVA